jgi:hypothetical protein
VLSEPNKQLRIQYALNNINLDQHLLDLMMDVVHLDEKWFNMKQVNKTYFLAEGEAEPHRTSSAFQQSKTSGHCATDLLLSRFNKTMSSLT